MSDRKKTADTFKSTPEPRLESPTTPKRGTDAPLVVREVTKLGRSWTILGTDVPAKRSRD